MADDAGSPPPPTISVDAYRAFIRGLDLSSIWLSKCSVENMAGPGVSGAEIAIEEETSWRPWAQGFEALSAYTVDVTTPDGASLGRISVTFTLRYNSTVPITEDLFSVFRTVNLPVNSWPYLRQFLSDTAGRMGWLPFTLPAVKRGVPPKTASEKQGN